ncbi:Putative tetratricopeptide-like helical domain superfamily [Colletotrichum destructivum]|uniref:Tetratricopeptide-like helical domain superfamily n=1 Tax=Colletotrichum destructivum TaxID=34406 RepID=A0AAX4IZN4_9PEZI|nr:Putative tetratricopeptide-like helical domain superfamily [Colletotrichum destructivum]
MSLGVTLPWRARSHCIGVPGVSLIPRGPRRWSRATPAQLSPSHFWMHSSSEATKCSPRNAIAPQHEANAESPPEPASHGNPTVGTGEQPVVDAGNLSPERRTDQGRGAEYVDRAFETRENEPQPSRATAASTSAGEMRKPLLVRRTRPLNLFKKDYGKFVVRTSKPDKRPSQKNKEMPKDTAATPEQRDPVLVAPAIQYNARRETQTSYQRSSQGSFRQLRLQAIRFIKQEPLTNWRATLEIMRMRTRPLKSPWQTRARRISVGPDLGNKLLYEVDHTIWDIQEQTRCHIELYWPEDANGRESNDGIHLLLSGDEDALEHASEEILRLASQSGNKISIDGVIDSTLLTTKTEESSSCTVERLWESSVESQRPGYVGHYTYFRPYHKIPKPLKWTPQTFLAYITAITNVRFPERLVSRHYRSGTAANEAAISLLHAAFEDRATSKAHSVRAFKKALQFMELHGHSHRDDAREFLRKRTESTLPIDTGTFNIVLSGSVKVKDLYNFDSVLRLMIHYGCLPNAQTWSLFLELTESEQVRRHAIHMMHRLGLFTDPVAIRLIAKTLVVHEIHRVRDSWPGIREFLRSQNAKYGTSWVSRGAMNKMMNELGRLGHFACCQDLLDIMAQLPSTTPTSLTINMILLHARSQRNFTIALLVLRRANELGIALNEQSYHELFSLAFRLRKPNAMGLIWRYACLEGKTSWYMRRRVSDLMEERPEGQTRTDGKRTADDFPALPTFHEENMAPRPSKNLGPWVAGRLYSRYVTHRAEKPLHELLEVSREIDSRIHQVVKQAKQQSDRAIRITVPGMRIYLRQRIWMPELKIWGPNLESPRRSCIEMTVTHLAPECGLPAADDGENASPDRNPDATKGPDLETIHGHSK